MSLEQEQGSRGVGWAWPLRKVKIRGETNERVTEGQEAPRSCPYPQPSYLLAEERHTFLQVALGAFKGTVGFALTPPPQNPASSAPVFR